MSGSAPQVLFVTSDRIGDCVMSSGAIREIGRQVPGAEITVACGPTAAALFRAAPGVVKVIPWRKQKAAGHWRALWRATVGTRWAMLLPFAINPFNLIILINFFRSLPGEIEEAALIDGLGYFGILRQIILPLSTASLATIGLYYAVFFWNDWFNGLIYLNSRQYPVMLFLRNIVIGTSMVGDGAGSADRSSIAISIKSAVIIISTLPIIILYPILQRFFIAGLTVGSVKG